MFFSSTIVEHAAPQDKNDDGAVKIEYDCHQYSIENISRRGKRDDTRILKRTDRHTNERRRCQSVERKKKNDRQKLDYVGKRL
jgi:hypothetical protein